MKRTVLIDVREGGDWSLDLLFSGLVRNLGSDRIVDYPPQKKHRMGRVSTSTGDPERDWGAERMSLSHSPGSELPGTLVCFGREDVKRMIATGGVERVFLDERSESFEAYLSLGAQFFDVPVVVVAGHDKFWNVSPEFVRQNYYKERLERMFLDNWRPEYDALPYARLYNWSINFDHLWNPALRDLYRKEKVYDLCFMGYNSHGNRSIVIDHVLSRWGRLDNHIVLERRPNEFGCFVPKREYFKKMAQSKICLNVRGAAECGKAMRFYEIPYVGSCMLSEKFPGKQIAPFRHDLECRYFGSLDELDYHVEELLARPVVRENIAENGHRHAMARHTVERRVRDMLEDLTGGPR